jgi:hypothetical protein
MTQLTLALPGGELATQQLSLFDFLPPAPLDNPTAALVQVAHRLLPYLQKQRPITNQTLQSLMGEAFGGSDAQGCWQWKQACEALEMAQAAINFQGRGSRVGC